MNDLTTFQTVVTSANTTPDGSSDTTPDGSSDTTSDGSSDTTPDGSSNTTAGGSSDTTTDGSSDTPTSTTAETSKAEPTTAGTTTAKEETIRDLSNYPPLPETAVIPPVPITRSDGLEVVGDVKLKTVKKTSTTATYITVCTEPKVNCLILNDALSDVDAITEEFARNEFKDNQISRISEAESNVNGVCTDQTFIDNFSDFESLQAAITVRNYFKGDSKLLN